VTDAKYEKGSKYWRVRHGLWVMMKEGNIEEVLGDGGYSEVMTCGLYLSVEEVVDGRWDG